MFSPIAAKKSVTLPAIIPKASIAMANLREPSSEFLKYATKEVTAINKAPNPVAIIAPLSPLNPVVTPLIEAFISLKAALPFASIVFS